MIASSTYSIVQRFTAALERSGVPCCVLRDGVTEVDLLAWPGSVDVVRAEAERLEMIALPSHGRGTHRFFLAWDDATASLVELDVVFELAYGAFASLPTDLAEGCLQRRISDGTVHRLSSADQFWTLLLHCLLDKRGFSKSHRLELGALADAVDGAEPAARLIDDLSARGWTSGLIAHTVRHREWTSVAGAGPELSTAMARRSRTDHWLRLAQGALGRTVEPFERLGSRRGPRIAVLGPDGSGKSTLTAELSRTNPLPARTIHMKLWVDDEPPWYRPIAIALRPARAWGWWACGAWHSALGRLVLYDRYTYDALVGLEGATGRPKRVYLQLLARCCPGPDSVMVLEANAATCASRRPEEEPATLDRLCAAYKEVVGNVAGARVIHCDENAEGVRAKAMRELWRTCRRKWAEAA